MAKGSRSCCCCIWSQACITPERPLHTDGMHQMLVHVMSTWTSVGRFESNQKETCRTLAILP